jgi:alkylation response protein AidB-like acyl-CoA dehydrogenase
LLLASRRPRSVRLIPRFGVEDQPLLASISCLRDLHIHRNWITVQYKKRDDRSGACEGNAMTLANADADGAAAADLGRERILAAARHVAGVAGREAEAGDLARQISGNVIGAMIETGLHRMMQPKAYGGLERPFLDLIEVIEIIARADGSAGWVFSVLAGHSSIVRRFSRAAQDEVWGADPNALASSSFAPVGRLEFAAGGFVLSGDYSFSSGCDHAQWAIVGAMRPPQGDAAVDPRPLLLLVPLTDVTIVDDWHTLGLRGTGSRTLRIAGKFVPAHRTLVATSQEGTVEPLALAAAMVGMARGAVDAFVDIQKAKTGTRGRVPPVESELVQLTVGQAYAECEAAAALLTRDVARASLVEGADYPFSLRAELRGMGGLIARLATQAVDRVQIAGGGQAIYDNSMIQRRFRDVHGAAQHTALNPETAFRQGGVMRLAPRLYRPVM